MNLTEMGYRVFNARDSRFNDYNLQHLIIISSESIYRSESGLQYNLENEKDYNSTIFWVEGNFFTMGSINMCKA